MQIDSITNRLSKKKAANAQPEMALKNFKPL